MTDDLKTESPPVEEEKKIVPTLTFLFPDGVHTTNYSLSPFYVDLGQMILAHWALGVEIEKQYDMLSKAMSNKGLVLPGGSIPREYRG